MTAGRASAVPAKRHSNTAMKIVGKDCAVTGEQLQRADQRAEVHARETLGDFPGFRQTALDGEERFAGAIVNRLEIADGRLRVAARAGGITRPLPLSSTQSLVGNWGLWTVLIRRSSLR